MGSNGLQNEFEEFIQNIIEQVSEEIYMEDLKKIYDSYQKCLKGMQVQTKQLSDSAKQMSTDQKTIVGEMTSMKNAVEEKTNQIEKALDVFYGGYKDILQQYEEKIIFINDKERQSYAKQLQGIIAETQKKERENLTETFQQYENKIQKLTGTIATAESLNQVVDEMEQVRTTIQNSTSLKYAEIITDFENRIKSVGLRERQSMEEKVRATFQAESEKTKQMLQTYQKSLTVVAEKTMTQKDMIDFEKNLAKYTKTIQSLTESRYQEVLAAFEQKLFQMGSQQFSNYIRKLNETALKVSDLEVFIQQIRLLEESMKQGVKKSEEEYKMIFSGFRSDVQKVNQETRNEFMQSLTELFGQQYDRMKQCMDNHIQIMENFKKEQRELVQCVEMIKELAGKNHSNLKLMARVIAGISQKEDAVIEKLNYTADAIEDNTRQIEYTVKLVEDSTKQMEDATKQMADNKELLEHVIKQNENGVKQMQATTRKLDNRTMDLSERLDEIIKNGKDQNIVLQALLGDSPNWRVDLFDKIEVNLVYVIIAMLAWICFKVS